MLSVVLPSDHQVEPQLFVKSRVSRGSILRGNKTSSLTTPDYKVDKMSLVHVLHR